MSAAGVIAIIVGVVVFTVRSFSKPPTVAQALLVILFLVVFISLLEMVPVEAITNKLFLGE